MTKNGQWILINQEAPDDSKPWGVGRIRDNVISGLTWYYKEDDARAAMNRCEYPSSR
jgi:hypothetical protein